MLKDALLPGSLSKRYSLECMGRLNEIVIFQLFRNTEGSHCHKKLTAQNLDTRLTADGLIIQIEQLDTAFMTIVWHTISERFNATSLCPQKVNIDLLTVVAFCRKTFYDIYEKAKSYVATNEYKDANTRKKRR